MTATPSISPYAKLSRLAAVTGLRDPEPQLIELERLGVVGVERYAKKLEHLLKTAATRVELATAASTTADIDGLQEEYWSLTREGAVAGWLATFGVRVTMEPMFPRRGPDLSAEFAGQQVYFEVKRLKIVLNPDPDARNARVMDTVAAAHRQLVDGAVNVVVVIDRDPARDTHEVEDALNDLATEASRSGTLKRLSAVLYEAPVAVGSDPLPSGWLFRDFDSGGVALPTCVARTIREAFRPRDIKPTDIEDWVWGGCSILDV